MPDLIAWRQNEGSLHVAVLAHRAAAQGLKIRRASDGYILPDRAAHAAQALGIAVQAKATGAGSPIAPPRIALFAGSAIGYPYYAYYAHCLLSLGLPYMHVDARDLVQGALNDVDLFIIPGGFATWGLDRAEGREGADAAIQAFIAGRGAVIGSCGGAFYLSEGRSGWVGLVSAKPKYTHEYLQTGAGIVNVRMLDPMLGAGLPGIVEMPYYHGPVYSAEMNKADVLATFDSLALSSRLFINNPLQRQMFEHEMQGRPAVLMSDSELGQAIAFSPHPEMGEFVRKAIALDGYVRKYLPIRGERVMDETLRFYATEDCASFRLVLNAMDKLNLFSGGERPWSTADAVSLEGLSAALERFQKVQDVVGPLCLRKMIAREDRDLAKLVGADMRRLSHQWAGHSDYLIRCMQAAHPRLDADLCVGLTKLLGDAEVSLTTIVERPIAEALALFELPVRILAAAVRLIQTDFALEALRECNSV